MLLYEVQEGDTPKSIALNAGISREALAFVNGHTPCVFNVSTLTPGSLLHIPIVLCKADLRRLRDALKDK